MESGLKKTPQDIILATNREWVQISLYMDIKSYTFTGVGMTPIVRLLFTWAFQTLPQAVCDWEWEMKLAWLLSLLHGRTCHASGFCCSPSFLFHNSQPAQGAVRAREHHFGEQFTGFGMLLESFHLPLVNLYGSDAAHKIKYFIKERSLKRAEGSLDSTEDIKSCTGQKHTRVLAKAVRGGAYFCWNILKSGLWPSLSVQWMENDGF